jgi:lipase chaperone LimK
MAARVAGVNVYPFVPFEERKKIINKEKFMISKLKAERSKIMRDQSLSDKEKDKEFERLSGLIEERRQEIFKYREESEIPASME